MKKVHRILLLCLLIIASLLTGCNSSDNPPASEKGNQTNDKTITVDNYGRKITLKEHPQKVLTLGPNCTELFVALGLTDYVIGNSLNNHSRGPLPEYSEAFKKIPELNYGPATRESVISSGADFILWN